MGAWSVSITGNDTAADLRYEYEAAFSRLPPEEAVERLDAYVRRELDGDSWPDYVFSLALFLWKHGLLTAGVRSRALALIQSGAGLDLYGSPALRRKREKVLADFAAQGGNIYGTFLEGNDMYGTELSQDGVIVMGSEGRGISPQVARMVNRKLFVPPFPAGRHGSESLNVAAATAVVCAEFRRRAR